MTPIQSQTRSEVAAGQLIMQYSITLPADYDMSIIRHRVATRGSALDDRAGLLCKAYCIREVGVDGSTVNQYAPFYLWADAAAAADFLWHGTGFDHIVRDFGRPQVRTWVPETRVLGPAPASSVSHAVIRHGTVRADAGLVEAVGQVAARVDRRHGDERVHLALGGVDPRTWQTVEFATLAGLELPGSGHEKDTEDVVFTVLHLSQPVAW